MHATHTHIPPKSYRSRRLWLPRMLRNIPHHRALGLGLRGRFRLHPFDRGVPAQNGNGDEHGHGFEDIEAPFVAEGVAVDSEAEFDDAVDGSDLNGPRKKKERLAHGVKERGEIQGKKRDKRMACMVCVRFECSGTCLDEKAGDPNAEDHFLHARVESRVARTIDSSHNTSQDEQKRAERRQLQRQADEEHVGAHLLQIPLPVPRASDSRAGALGQETEDVGRDEDPPEPARRDTEEHLGRPIGQAGADEAGQKQIQRCADEDGADDDVRGRGGIEWD